MTNPTESTHEPQRISPEEAARRQKVVQAAHHHNLMEGIRRDPATNEVYEAFMRGEIDVMEIGPLIDKIERP